MESRKLSLWPGDDCTSETQQEGRNMNQDILGYCQHETETGCLCMEPWPCPYHASEKQQMDPFGLIELTKLVKQKEDKT